ncbi:phage/plasmid primase, P4 family [Panacagrimonas sp.]|uniref:phage/plasmid primase, P4 family n=1 Tax=Panacagrimonas sp. TaxID=2480088 RepID=UPI003B525D2A
MSFCQAALALADRGFYVFPLLPGSKLPAIDNFADRATRDHGQIQAWWVDDVLGWEHDYNVGISTSTFGDDGESLCVVDEDNKNGKCGAESLLRLELEGLELPATTEQRTPTGGAHHVMRTSTPVANSVGKLGSGLDVRGRGGFIVGAGSVVPAGRYTINELPPAPAPAELILRCGISKERAELPDGAAPTVDEDRAGERFAEWLKTAPRSVKGDGGDACAFNTACKGRDFGCSASTALDLMLSEAWDDGCGWTADRLQEKVAHAFKYAKGAAGNASAEVQFGNVTPSVPEPIAPATLTREPGAVSDFGLACIATAKIGAAARYCDQRAAWFLWDGQRYALDTTRAVSDLVRGICHLEAARQRDAMLRADPNRPARADGAAARIRSRRTVADVETLLKADRTHAVSLAAFDADPWTLNTRAGLVDLQTGAVRPHDPSALCSKIAAAGIGDRCPTWLAFLYDATGGDAELIGYLQKLAGYATTGSTREHLVHFIYGTGGTGKTTFLETIAEVFGDYAQTADMALFTLSANDQHPTGLASLMGARLVIASETEQGARWHESRIKAVSGGDRIAARYMRGDFFEFVPTCKLVFAGNHRPHVRNVEDGLRRRLRLIPFERKPAKPDPELRLKLRAESDGILGWVLEGAAMWQRDGLQAMPAAIREATKDYFADEDDIGRWLDQECASATRDAFTESNLMFHAYSGWAQANGGYVGSLKRFAADLARRGFEKALHPTTRRSGFRGLTLRNDHGAGFPAGVS